MTEHPPPTQTAVPSQTLYATSTALGVSKDVPHKVETAEGESYTMKCICNFSGDDGSTIYCERCDTWQHIDCFYPDNRQEALRDDFAHFCHECQPRPLDIERAVQRGQRLQIQQQPVTRDDTLDKKPKKAASKSHKKRPKPTELQINGAQTGSDQAKHASPSDQHPTKKAKTSHKPSHSTSQAAKRSPSYGNGRPQTNGHPPSPATTPPDLPQDFEIHNYSANFVALHGEQDIQIVQNNSFASLAISNTMSLWLQDHDRLKKETGQDYRDVYQKLPADIESKKRVLRVEHKTYSPTAETQLQIPYLATPSAIEKDVPLMELNGQIGFQKDYCADPDNSWEELTSPLPFVFFHPMLPLCIDTRKEGSEARYVRRSCKPNAVLDTYLSAGSEYHFWLVSDRHIAAKEQITLPWDFRFPTKDKARMLHLLGLGDDEISGHDQPEMDEAEYGRLREWVHLILSEYGGCACDLGSNCAFARFHRHYLGRMQPRANPTKKKTRKPKTQNISPTSTDQATNSRAASEGHGDDGPDNDGRSTSRSKPPSRDRTPMRQGSFDQLGILTEPTDRDKRKVAMVEDSFRRMEQQQPPRKKKRVSDGTGHGGHGASSSTKSKSVRTTANTTPNLSNGVHYVDAGTSRSKSGSPASAISPSAQFASHPHRQEGSIARRSRQASSTPRTRPNYVDASVQTDPVEGEWFSEHNRSPKPRRRILSLSQRLLNCRHQQRIEEEERRKQQALQAASTAMDVDSPLDQRSAASSPVLAKDSISTAATSPGAPSGDVPMTDAPSGSPTSSVPGQTAGEATNSRPVSPVKLKTPDLRVQMPAVPNFNNTASSIASSTTPLSAQSPFSNLASPFGAPIANGIQPSPVKKKMSFSDYRARLDKAAAGKPQSTLKPAHDESKPSTLETIVDSPTAEKAATEGASPNMTNTALPNH